MESNFKLDLPCMWKWIGNRISLPSCLAFTTTMEWSIWFALFHNVFYVPLIPCLHKHTTCNSNPTDHSLSHCRWLPHLKYIIISNRCKHPFILLIISYEYTYIWIPTNIIHLCRMTSMYKHKLSRSFFGLFRRKCLSNLPHNFPQSIHDSDPISTPVDPLQQKPECFDSPDSKWH